MASEAVKMLSSKYEKPNKGLADVEVQNKVLEDRLITNKGHVPTLQVTRSFDQQVKKLIAEAVPNSAKAALGKQLLQDQAVRLSQIMSRVPDESFPEKASKDVANSLEPITKPRYTPSGRKLFDMSTSVQAVISVDKVGSSPNTVKLGSSKYQALQRPVRQIRTPSSARVSRRSPAKLQTSYKSSKRITTDSAPILDNTSPAYKSKLMIDSVPDLLPKHHPLSNLSPAQIPSKTLSFSKAKQQSSIEIPVKPKKSLSPLVGGSVELVTSSRIARSLSKPKESTLIRAISSHKSGVPIGSSNALERAKQASQKVKMSQTGSFGEHFSAMLKKRSTKESDVYKVDTFQYDFMKQLRMNSLKKPHAITPGEVIQSVSGQSSNSPSIFHADSTRLAGQKRSPKPSLQLSSQGRSFVTMTSKEMGSQRGDSKLPEPTESVLKQMLMYCDCPDSEISVEDEMPEMKFDFNTFKRSLESKDLRGDARPKIRSVKRSSFERKDRAARAAFAKELEQMEIFEIEKKQRLKPRKIKNTLKKEGVYETIKNICHIPDSLAGTLRGSPSRQSIGTGLSVKGPTPSVSAVEKCSSPSSSLLEDKIQLRKDNSTGSRATPVALTREGAFHEIELSDESDSMKNSCGSSPSSNCEIISSSSEISLRVNLDKTYSPEERRKKRARNAHFTQYQNKINAELIIAERPATTPKQLESNLEGIIIDKIATEFGEWAKENGVKPEAVEKDVIKELFQFGTMDTAANSIAVEIKELIIVPESITEGLYPELEERAGMYRQVLFDEGAYWRTERYMAFGKPDPKPYKRPPNPPLPMWMKSGFVPRPLATGELLYQTLIDNDSMMLERYVLWMVENPKHYRPPYLIGSGYFQKIVDKHGGSEDKIRKQSAAMKSLSMQAGKRMVNLNFGMQSDLRKLKEMGEGGKKPKAQG